jgi:uncharacterized protein YndB with AHSA1/START domain
MNMDLVTSKTVEINADVTKVWDALTNPEIIKQYLFGTEVVTDWKVGSEIIFQGNYEGKEYRDKGKIEKIESNKLFQYLYWSGFSGLEDKEENYSLVTFELNTDNETTALTVSQKGFTNDLAQEHSDQSWGMVLQKIKEIVEN